MREKPHREKREKGGGRRRYGNPKRSPDDESLNLRGNTEKKRSYAENMQINVRSGR